MLCEEDVKNQHFLFLQDFYSNLTSSARKLEVWLSLGGFHERGHDWESDQRIYNSHIIINDTGAVLSTISLLFTHKMDQIN